MIKIDVGSTKILCPIPIDEQHAFVQELAGDTLTIDIMNGEGNEALKDAFLKFIAVRLILPQHVYKSSMLYLRT